MEGSKTNISRHIFIITGVIAVELRERNIRLKFLCIEMEFESGQL